MYAQITEDKSSSEKVPNYTGTHVAHIPGRYSRQLVIEVDNDAAEVIRFFVDALMGRTKPLTTDQRDVTRQ